MLRLIAGFLALSASITAWSRDRDLQLAEKYFTKRKSELAALSTPRAGALVQQPVLERLVPRGYETGQRWSVRLSVTRPPLNSPEVRQQKVATLRYTVVDWSGFEEGRLVLKIEAPDSPNAGLFIEERIFFREGRSELRRCRSSSSCSPWISHDSQTLRLAGEDSGLGWEHGPVLLAGDTLLKARLLDGKARFESEDFFGRRCAWTWNAGDPWPTLLESAQGRAELLKQGDEQ